MKGSEFSPLWKETVKAKKYIKVGKRKVTSAGFLVVMTTCLPWTQLGNQRGGSPLGFEHVLFLNTHHQENTITNPWRW